MTDQTRLKNIPNRLDKQAPATTSRLADRTANGSPGGEPPPARLPAAAGSGKKVTLEQIVAEVRHLPALPMVVVRVMQLTGEGEGSARALAKEISGDPNFAARILQLANSAYYGLPRTVGTISEAVVLLGMRTVRNMAIAAATHETLNCPLAGYELGQGDLWRHSMACAMAAKMIAEKTHYPEPEEAFVAGLLHDIGKVVLSLYVQETIAEILARAETESLPFLEAERAVLGFDHADVGGRVARKWNLPNSLVQAIAWHHQPVQNGQVAPLAAIVHIANAVCLCAGFGLGADGLRAELSSSAMTALKLTEVDVENVLDRLVTQVAQAQPVFEMPFK